MKKTYINPSIMVVNLGMVRPIAASGLQSTLGNEYDSGDVTYTKENNITDINIWDEEW